jgi:RNA polymerase sigma-70 factor (ECF subfamily)
MPEDDAAGDDAERFGRVVLPHLDAAWRLARWLVRDPAAAEDVVQDALVRALTYFASYRGGDGRAWLLRIVRNTATTRGISVGRRAEDRLEPEDGGAHAHLANAGDTPEAILADREREAALRDRLDALPPELREALVLKELEELSYRDIAEITGVPIGTVMSRLWRARQALLGARAKDPTP